MDLVVFVIIKQVIPHQQRRFEQIFVVKWEKVDWQKAFKKEWKILAKKTIDNIYLTDILNWIYRCLAFLTNRFLICKHLVQQKEVDIEFFNQIYHHHQYPFLNRLPIYINNFGSSSQITNKFDIVEIVEEDDLQDCKELYSWLVNVMEKTLEILKD